MADIFLFQQNSSEIEQIANDNAIKFIGLFGSAARGEQTEKSDLDLYIKFDFSEKSIGLFELYRIQKLFEKTLGKEVDIVTNPNKFVLPHIQKDLVTVYERR
ncbi:MAG: nucleotidyltransferase domain-containing protein [bacterium]|nr:nucleotidyltransferase domain-containing protein [bacterium]